MCIVQIIKIVSLKNKEVLEIKRGNTESGKKLSERARLIRQPPARGAQPARRGVGKGNLGGALGARLD